MPLVVAALVQLLVDVPTATQNVAVSATLPETPVTVIWYAPTGVVEPAAAVNVEVCAVVVLKVSEEEAKLHVGSVALVAVVGAVVTAQVSVTVPVNELPGVTVIVSVLLDPNATATLPLVVSAKLVALVFGDCQKFPQPAISAAAAVNPAQITILIAAHCAEHRPRRLY
jgi:hypothetical protein